MKRVATVILNRNLPGPTNELYEQLMINEGSITDIYVLEAGSRIDNISKYCTWHASDPDSMQNGLRYCRGTNYALFSLFHEKRWEQYDAFFILTNDTVISRKRIIRPMLAVLDEHPKVGILSPCSKRWGEKELLKEIKTRYFWFINNNALLFRREFLESIMQVNNPDFLSFIFDGSNFRGYLADVELISKAYANDWAAAITSHVFAEENESYLLEQADLIETEPYKEHMRLYIEEGKKWIHQKYGFNSQKSMIEYAKSFYDAFFRLHPELGDYMT